MEHFPALFVLNGRPALVVGGGGAAYREARQLADAGACVTVIAPELGREMSALVEEGSANHRDKAFAAGDLAGQTLVIAATGIPAVDADVSAAARTRGLPVNVIDARKPGSFIILTAEAVARLRKFDSRRFWKWFFARLIASAVFGIDQRAARKQTGDAMIHGSRKRSGCDTATEDFREVMGTVNAAEQHDVPPVGGKPSEAHVEFFEVRFPTIGALFMAHEVEGALVLTSVKDVRCLYIEAGERLTAQEVVRRVRLLDGRASRR